jgi:hypothetical protein
MHDLSGLVRMPSDYDSAALFLRTMAFQQFWLQERISLPRPARQSLIFGHLQKNHPFRRAFSEHTGMTIEHFIELEIALLTRFLTGNEPFVTAGWFRSIEPSYPPGTVQTFLSMLSLNLDSLRNYLTETDSASASISYQFYERTPLSRYPLLEYGTNYYCYNKTLLFYALQGFIYDLLRAQDPNAFMNKFGPVFEKYVGRSLACSGVPFLMSRAV